MKTLPDRALELFEKDRKEFESMCGPLSKDQISDLEGFLKAANAAQQGREGYVARAFKFYPIDFEKQKFKPTGNPAIDLENLIGIGAQPAKIVLWQEGVGRRLNAGIFCRDISIGIAVLILFRWARARTIETAKCVICGEHIERKRAQLRMTCSSRCRTRKFRLGRQQHQPHSLNSSPR